MQNKRVGQGIIREMGIAVHESVIRQYIREHDEAAYDNLIKQYKSFEAYYFVLKPFSS